jgi:glyoxylase-like metal-dependent hydrolase (beta-lactamase superfamily II)
MKIHLLRCATMCPLGGGAPRSVVPRALTCNCLLVETSDGLALVDTGVGTADMLDPRRLGVMSRFMGLASDLEDTAVRQVERLGFSKDDVRHILPTHLDLDHAGGLPDFPAATVHVLARERDAALSPGSFRRRERYRACHFAHDPKWAAYDPGAGEAWNGFDRVRELRGLPPEILMIALPGHSPGHAGIAIRTASGWLLHAGDAFYDRRQMTASGAITPGMKLFEWVAHDARREARRTEEKLRALALSDPTLQVLCAHDAGEAIAAA